MTYLIKLLPVVKKDLQKARLWYKKINKNLSEDFKKEVNKEIDSVSLSQVIRALCMAADQ